MIDNYLSPGSIRDRAVKKRYPHDQVYLDFMQVYVAATCKVFKALQEAGVEFNGFDAATYLASFTTKLAVDRSQLEFRRLWFMGLCPLSLIPIPA